MDGQPFDPRQLAQQAAAGPQFIGGGVLASPGVATTASNKLTVSRTAGAASRLHDLVDMLEKFVHGAHSHVDRIAGGGSPAATQQVPQPPPAESQMHRLEQGLQRFEAVLKSDAAALYQRISEL